MMKPLGAARKYMAGTALYEAGVVRARAVCKVSWASNQITVRSCKRQPAVMVCPACITAAIVANAPTVLAGKAVNTVCCTPLLRGTWFYVSS